MKERIVINGLVISFILAVILIIFFGVGLYKQHQFSKNRLLELEGTVNLDEGDKKKIRLADPNKSVIYKIEDENVAKIDDNGNIVAVGKGETKITVTSEDNSKKQTVTIKVDGTKKASTTKKPSTGTINPSNKNTTNSTNKNNNNSNTNNTNKSNKNNTSSNTNISTSNKNNSSSNNNTSNKNSTSNSSRSNNNNSSNTTTPSVVRVSSVSLNKTNQTINLNSGSSSFTVLATVSPYNASNKGVNWSSSNNSVATVNGGIVTAKNPGTTVITVSTQDGNKSASMTVTVTKRVIIVVGASQVKRMENATSYKDYNTSNGSLVYIANSDSGIEYQYNAGLTSVKNTMDKYSSAKGQVQFYVFFPLSGNTIKGFTCDQITTDNSSIKEYAKGYNNAIGMLKNNGYNVNGYVVSMHPVRTNEANSSYIVPNTNNNACLAGYRSNYKYNKFNNAIGSIVNSSYSYNLKYIQLFTQIMNIGNGGREHYSFKVTYNTTDGMHWDSETAKYYVNLMLSNAGI